MEFGAALFVFVDVGHYCDQFSTLLTEDTDFEGSDLWIHGRGNFARVDAADFPSAWSGCLGCPGVELGEYDRSEDGGGGEDEDDAGSGYSFHRWFDDSWWRGVQRESVLHCDT